LYTSLRRTAITAAASPKRRTRRGRAPGLALVVEVVPGLVIVKKKRAKKINGTVPRIVGDPMTKLKVVEKTRKRKV